MKEQVQEIDLIDLFLKFFGFVKNRLKILLISAITGAVTGGIFYFTLPAKFEQELIGYSPVVTTKIIEESLMDIINPAYEATLSESSTNEEYIRTIKKIRSIKTEKITSRDKELLKIVFTSIAPISSASLINVVTQNLSAHTYIRNKIEINKAQLDSIIDFIDNEIKVKQEELKLCEESDRTFIINSEETPSSLYIKMKKYEEELAFMQPIVITKATNMSKPAKPSLVTYVITGAFVGVLLLVVFLGIRRINGFSERQINKE